MFGIGKNQGHMALSELKEGEIPSVPVDLNDEDFDKVLKKYPLVVVDFWASWCMPCRMMSPVMASLAEEYSGKVLFTKISTEHNKKVAMRHHVSGIPTVMFFKNGKLVDKMVGAAPKDYLKALVDKNFGM